MRSARIAALALLVSLLHGVVWGEPKRDETTKMVQMDFRDVELKDVITSMAEITGKNFVISGEVRGRVTIVSPKAVSVREAYQTFLSALNVNGYATCEVGPAVKIVPLRDATTCPGPVLSDEK